MGKKTGQLIVDVDDDEAIEKLKTLRDNGDVRKAIETNPRQGLKRHLDIDFPNAPASVKLPSPPAIAAYVKDLEAEKNRGAEGKYAKLAHGIILLYVAHGNGLPSPAP
jgi:hypothetical protein